MHTCRTFVVRHPCSAFVLNLSLMRSGITNISNLTVCLATGSSISDYAISGFSFDAFLELSTQMFYKLKLQMKFEYSSCT